MSVIKPRFGVRGRRDEPRPLEFLAFQVHGHHPPREILHALLIGKLTLCFAVQLPYLSAKGIISGHFFGVANVCTGSIVAPIGEDGVTEDIPAGLIVDGWERQLGL